VASLVAVEREAEKLPQKLQSAIDCVADLMELVEDVHLSVQDLDRATQQYEWNNEEWMELGSMLRTGCSSHSSVWRSGLQDKACQTLWDWSVKLEEMEYWFDSDDRLVALA